MLNALPEIVGVFLNQLLDTVNEEKVSHDDRRPSGGLVGSCRERVTCLPCTSPTTQVGSLVNTVPTRTLFPPENGTCLHGVCGPCGFPSNLHGQCRGEAQADH